MMFYKKQKKRALGLDIGSGSIKAVELQASAQDGVAVLGCRKLRLRAEGILDEAELSGSLSGWLDQSSWKDLDICIGLPQYLSTVQVRDFPVASDDALRDMISYETAQLSGISEESFIHDYHVMPPKFGKKNPVLIGISRYSAVADRLKALESAGILPSDITMNSMALLNSLFFLRPEIRNVDSLQMLVEIGAENSVLVIFAGGQILSISSLLFGAEKYTRAVAEARSLDMAKAEEEKLMADRWTKDESFSRISAALVSEVRNALDQWRNHESAEFSDKEIVKIWICGGGAASAGLPEFMKSSFKQSQVEVFGPKDENGIAQPDLSTAFGLALQALGEAPLRISLTPEHIRWTARKKRNFPYLSAALFFLVLSAFLLLLAHYADLKMRDGVNRKTILRLRKCSELIPQIESLSSDISHHEKMLLPFVAKGNNIPKLISALADISAASEENIALVFLCDESAYRSLQPGKTEKAAPKFSMFDSASDGSAGASSAATQAVVMSVEDVRETDALVLYGFTLSSGKNEHYEIVRRFQSRLGASSLFGGQGREVDIIPDDDSPAREAILSTWFSRVVNNKDVYSALGRSRLRDFALRLPFEETCLNTAALEHAKGAKSK